MMFVRQAPEGGYDYWTFYDILLIQMSLFNGVWAFLMLFFFIRSLKQNLNQIDYLKNQSLIKQGKADQIKVRGQRTYMQTLRFIFGEEELSFNSFKVPHSLQHKREITFEAMIKAAIEEYE